MNKKKVKRLIKMTILRLRTLLFGRRVTLLQYLVGMKIKNKNVKLSLNKAQIDDRYTFAKLR